MVDLTRSTPEIKAALVAAFSASLDELFAAAGSATGEGNRQLERAVWGVLGSIGQLLLSAVFAVRCRAAAEANILSQGLALAEVDFRFGPDFEFTVNTTLGRIKVPTFAWRIARECGSVVRTARDYVFPLREQCLSSELLLEWEVRLGSDNPFRQAQEELGFFSHGRAFVADNTIANHVTSTATSITDDWLYRPLRQIREVLRDRATLDPLTGRPIIYISCDAHALRRYVDDTWTTQWKMANGLRAWCIDRETDETIHIGGQFTWGDCQVVAQSLEGLIASGILPADGDYGDGVVAKYNWLSDGMGWFETRLLPLFGNDAISVTLDAYHLLERAAECAAAIYGKGSAKCKAWYGAVAQEVAGPKPERTEQRERKPRKNHKKSKKRGRARAAEPLPVSEAAVSIPEDDHTPRKLLDLAHQLATSARTDAHNEAVAKLSKYIIDNAYRINYAAYRHLGWCIGSGSMESIHIIGSQQRLKRPGARWLPTTSQALFNWRMLKLVGRWEEFWQQPDLSCKLRENWKTPVIDYPLADAA